MNCPRCECHIADGFYCIQCGCVPKPIDARTNTNASIFDITIPQASRGILKEENHPNAAQNRLHSAESKLSMNICDYLNPAPAHNLVILVPVLDQGGFHEA